MEFHIYSNKTMKKLLLILIIAFACYACNDVTGSANNIVKENLDNPDAKELISLELSDIDMGTIKKGEIKTISLIMSNRSNLNAVRIKNLKFEGNSGMEVFPSNGYPVVILPDRDNTASPFYISFNTSGHTPGKYSDRIIINGLKEYYIEVKAKVID